MSIDDIVAKVCKLSTEERHLLYAKLNELYDARLGEDPELSAARDEVRANSEENNLTAEEIRQAVTKSAHAGNNPKPSFKNPSS